ncbi:unnamed protein product, partial [Timema podura]|nr:unnamed protein product [Timema podura]
MPPPGMHPPHHMMGPPPGMLSRGETRLEMKLSGKKEYMRRYGHVMRMEKERTPKKMDIQTEPNPPPHMMGGPMGMPPPPGPGPGPYGPPSMGCPPPQQGGPHQQQPPQMSNSGSPGGNNPPSNMPNNMMPGMDLSGEIWVETKTSEGKSYFYNARTRDTTWSKPEGPNVKIITQEQVQACRFDDLLLF